MSVPANNISANNKRIAKNTLMLYFRMAVTMAISIFTTRILLDALGVEDFGLANVVGGVVTMFAFISSTMNTATSRFITFELGRGNAIRLKQIFNLTQLIFAALILILFVLCETAGVWFLLNHVSVPAARAEAVFWFFQFTIFSFLLGIANTPYTALIIAHENMKTFAWISIFEAVAKLAIVYILFLSSFDHLIFYGALLCVISAIHFALYYITCRKNYAESRFAFFFEKKLFIDLLAFGGWNLWGACCGLFSGVFVNVLLNNYFGSAVNAARSIANQVSTSAAAFTNNFLTASRPQITKYFASGNFEQCYVLTMRSSRLGYFLFYFIALPAWILCPIVLQIWLDDVPAHSIWFLRIILIQALIDTLSLPLMTIAQASGRVALYQSVVGGMLWLNLPFSWLAFHFGAPPESFAIVALIIAIICLFLRMILIRRCAKLPFWRFVKSVLVPVAGTSILAAIVPVALNTIFFPEPSILQFFVIGFVCVFSTVPAILFLGFAPHERASILKLLKSKIPFPQK